MWYWTCNCNLDLAVWIQLLNTIAGSHELYTVYCICCLLTTPFLEQVCGAICFLCCNALWDHETVTFPWKELLKISVAGQMTSSPVIIICSCLLRAVVFPGPNSGAIDTVVKRRMKTQI
jgi:hypothetical protein